MSFVTPDPVISGVPYPITAMSSEKRPGSLEDFTGDTSFVIQMEAAHVVCGHGALDGDTVRFYEKDHDGTGKDIRVWRVSPAPEGGFRACHEAAW